MYSFKKSSGPFIKFDDLHHCSSLIFTISAISLSFLNMYVRNHAVTCAVVICPWPSLTVNMSPQQYRNSSCSCSDSSPYPLLFGDCQNILVVPPRQSDNKHTGKLTVLYL